MHQDDFQVTFYNSGVCEMTSLCFSSFFNLLRISTVSTMHKNQGLVKTILERLNDFQRYKFKKRTGSRLHKLLERKDICANQKI